MNINKELLQKELCGIPLIYFKNTDSTNTRAKELIFSQDAPFLVVAESQALGRGRMGRSFYSEGCGIYMSFVFKSEKPQSTVSVTTAAASGVLAALERASDSKFKIKWVNDILLDGKKVCGILCEGVSCGDEHFVIVGIGINVGKCTFPSELESIAGSVEISCPPEEIIADIAHFLSAFANDTENRDYMPLYRERFALSGKTVTAISNGETVTGRVLGVTDDGGLILMPLGGDTEIVILSGEVSIKSQNPIDN